MFIYMINNKIFKWSFRMKLSLKVFCFEFILNSVEFLKKVLLINNKCICFLRIFYVWILIF